MSEKKTILEVKGLDGGYKKTTIIREIDFNIKEHEIVCVLGPNGSGKSTLIKTIYGLAETHAGQVYYNQDNELKEITGLKPFNLVAKGIGYVPQRDNVFPNMTIEENLEMGSYLSSKEEMIKAKESVFEQYEKLSKRRDLKAKTLSGGERQILAVARALMLSPRLIMLDEPTAALQPNLVKELINEIKLLRDNNNLSVIFVEQKRKICFKNI